MLRAAQGRRLKSRQVGGEVADDLADPSLGNPRTPCVFHCHTTLYATYRDTQLGMTLGLFPSVEAYAMSERRKYSGWAKIEALRDDRTLREIAVRHLA